MRFCELVIADVTTLNFNLLFEIGFAIGLGKAVIPIRDTSYMCDVQEFIDLGLLDTVGYTDFQNSEQLSTKILQQVPVDPIPAPIVPLNLDAPLYVVKAPIETEGGLRLLAFLKRSAVRFRTYDAIETPRLSLYEARRQVAGSLGVIAHLLSTKRRGSLVHNARCALIAGIAMATGKPTLLLQEEDLPQPLDYRDVVKSYQNPDQVPQRTENIVLQVIQNLQTTSLRSIRRPEGLLQKLDIGDIAAENEIHPLASYFVETGPFSEARRGHARLVVGRKGSGKTAIFYALQHVFGGTGSRTIVDLKPEGHQFAKLRETVLARMTPGVQEHTLAAFWTYLLFVELAGTICRHERSWAVRHPERSERFHAVEIAYQKCGTVEESDFSERLLLLVERLSGEYATNPGPIMRPETTGALFAGDIKELEETLSTYLIEKSEVWFLIDNLDKGWPTSRSTSEDILILRTLLEATRKLQRQIEKRKVNFHCLVFLRNDIYDHLLAQTSDKGKDTVIKLDWSDAELFKEIYRRRVEVTGLVSGKFETAWRTVFDPAVGTRDSFTYIVERTLARPRDFLGFVHLAIEVAVNRGHDRVLENDLRQAEKRYSEDMLKMLDFELRDIYPDVKDILYEFLGCEVRMRKEAVVALLRGSTLSDAQYE
jgi:hypothetical protein